MSENDKDNNNFEFIKEQVIEKKRKKLKKWMFPPVMTICLGVLFGLTAALTFAIMEPGLNKLIHKEKNTKTAVCFPTEAPAASGSNTKDSSKSGKKPTPTPVIVKQSIDADISDYLSMNNDIKEVADKVDKSIVNINSTFTVKDWFGKLVHKTVNTTGVIIYNNSEDFLALVSLDRVKGADSIKVKFSDTISVNAKILDSVSEINLAVIAIPVSDIPGSYLESLQIAALGESYTIETGDPVIALGSPNGHTNSMEIGMITSTGGYASITDNRLDLFNTSIEDNSSSDGIIVNLDGEIIGLITRTLKEDEYEGLNTVIGISDLKNILTAMGNQDPLIYFGVKTDDMSTSAMRKHDVTNGIYVNDVKADSPAFKAGIQNGDIILGVDDATIMSSSNFYDTISDYQPGEKVTVKIKRTSGSKDKNIKLHVVLGKK